MYFISQVISQTQVTSRGDSAAARTTSSVTRWRRTGRERERGGEGATRIPTTPCDASGPVRPVGPRHCRLSPLASWALLLIGPQRALCSPVQPCGQRGHTAPPARLRDDQRGHPPPPPRRPATPTAPAPAPRRQTGGSPTQLLIHLWAEGRAWAADRATTAAGSAGRRPEHPQKARSQRQRARRRHRSPTPAGPERDGDALPACYSHLSPLCISLAMCFGFFTTTHTAQFRRLA